MSAKRAIDSARGLIRAIYDQLDDLEGELINIDLLLLQEFMLMKYPRGRAVRETEGRGK